MIQKVWMMLNKNMEESDYNLYQIGTKNKIVKVSRKTIKAAGEIKG